MPMPMPMPKVAARRKGPGRPAPDRDDAARRGRPGPDPVRSRHDNGPAASADRGTAAAGLAAAGLTARTARGCQVGQRWAGWRALLIGAASAPQAAASGFRSPYTIPDMATTALGMLLAITIMATAGRMGRRDTTPQFPVCWTGKTRGVPPRVHTIIDSREAGRSATR